MSNDTRSLIMAVSIAAKHTLDVNKFDDRLTMQKGCYILNSWGYGPFYRYSLYIRGPYSRTLADDYYSIGNIPDGKTDIPVEAINELSSIFDKGLGYVEAYATVLMIKRNSPGASSNNIRKRALDLKPNLKKEIEETSASLLT